MKTVFSIIVACLLVAFALLTVAAYAATYNPFLIQWTPPTSRTDDTPLLPSEIDHYQLYISLDGVDMTPLSLTGTQYQYTPTASGDYCYAMSTVDTGGREDGKSAEVCKVAVPLVFPPRPPSALTITEVSP